MDDDRIYFIDPARLIKIDDGRKTTAEIIETDDPNRFIYRITEPAPRYLIKRVNLSEKVDAHSIEGSV